MRDNEWMLDAPCRGSKETFFELDDDDNYVHFEAARKMCGGCNYRAACLDEFIYLRSTDGIWGGLPSDQAFKMIEMWDATDPYEEFGELAETVSWLLTP